MIESFLEQIVGLATAWLGLVLVATGKTLPILIIVGAIMAGLWLMGKRKIAPWLLALLLTLVVIRLLLPISFTSPLSLQILFAHWLPSASEDPSLFIMPPTHPTHVRYYSPSAETSLSPMKLATYDSGPESASFAWDVALWNTTIATLFLVSLGLILCSVLSHWRFARKLRVCRMLDDQPLVELLLREGDSLGVGRRPAVREVPSLSAPAVFGIFQQTICFPPNLRDTLSDSELRWVIRHELAHIRRRDVPVIMLASLARACHWFNPMVWLVAKQLRAAMEAAADHLALNSLEPAQVSGYGNLLLRLAQHNSVDGKSPTLGLISFSPSGRQLKRRIERLLQPQSSKRPVGCNLKKCFLAGLSFAGLTDATLPSATPELNLIGHGIVTGDISYAFPVSLSDVDSDATRFVVEYDLQPIFEAMSESRRTSNPPTLEYLAAWLNLSPAQTGQLSVQGQTLTANLPTRQHEILRQLLEQWRHGEPSKFVIEARIIQTDINYASSIDWASHQVESLQVNGQGPAIAARVNNVELTRFLQDIKADSQSKVSQMPTCTLFAGQTATIFDGCWRPFVTKAAPQADGTMQPIVSVFQDGLEFRLTPQADDKDSITLTFTASFSKIGDVAYANLPIKNSKHSAPGCTVQVPSTQRYEVSSTAPMAQGESILVAVPQVFRHEPGADANSTIIIALTPRIVEAVESKATLDR